MVSGHRHAGSRQPAANPHRTPPPELEGRNLEEEKGSPEREGELEGRGGELEEGEGSSVVGEGPKREGGPASCKRLRQRGAEEARAQEPKKAANPRTSEKKKRQRKKKGEEKNREAGQGRRRRSQARSSNGT